MDSKLFAELLESANEALEHAKGKRELRTTELPSPPAPALAADVRRLRSTMKMSQAVFARYLNISTKLVQAWESRRRVPEGPALLLLRLWESQPSLILAAREQVASTHKQKAVRKARPRAKKTRRLVAA